MNNHLRLRYAWVVLTGGVFIMSALPAGSWLGQVTAPYCTNPWLRFVAYAAIVSIPCAQGRIRSCLLSCLLAAGFSIACGVLHTDAGGPADAMGRILPDIFGLAAGALLGLNIRLLRSSARTVADVAPERRRQTIS